MARLQPLPADTEAADQVWTTCGVSSEYRFSVTPLPIEVAVDAICFLLEAPEALLDLTRKAGAPSRRARS